jgi:hypothetical protein
LADESSVNAAVTVEADNDDNERREEIEDALDRVLIAGVLVERTRLFFEIELLTDVSRDRFPVVPTLHLDLTREPAKPLLIFLAKLDENEWRVLSKSNRGVLPPPRPDSAGILCNSPDRGSIFDNEEAAATAQAAELRRDASTIRRAISLNPLTGSFGGLFPPEFLAVDALID